MPPSISKRWKTDPDYIDLFNFLIERTQNVKSPLNIKRLAREFKENSGAAPTAKCLQLRIERVRRIIHSFEHIATKTKVKVMFALSASVSPEFLKELKRDAFVENDDKKRITHYKANDGSLELEGDHSLSAKQKTGKQESKRSFRSLVNSYFEKKNDSDAVPKSDLQKEMGNLIEFITEKCESAETPLSISRLADDFVKKFRTSMASKTALLRITRYGLEIQRMEFVDTCSKVQQLFGLSATVNSDCLEILRKNALVEVDDRNRIVHYKANDGSLELRGDHTRSAKMRTAKLEPKQPHLKLIRNYFEKKNSPDAVPDTEEEKEMWNLIEWITEKCENADSPLRITRLAEDFIEHFRIQVRTDNIRIRMRAYCREIQKAELLDTQTSVKQLFSLGATVNSDYLEKLRKDAHVEVDEKNRISYFKANNGDLELRGDHSQSAKTRSGMLESKRSLRSFITSYFEKKNDADATPTSEEEKEMGNFIEFITEKCENVKSPLRLSRLIEDFIQKFGISVPLDTIRGRIRRYCQEIQIVEFLDTLSTVKQLFGLSATLDSDYLEKLRKDDVVEVDDLNRITKYTSNNGGLSLCGDHSLSAKNKSSWSERRKSKKSVKKHSNSDVNESEESETENEYSDDDSDEYSSEEFDSEFDSDDKNNPPDVTEYHVKPSNKADDVDNETPIKDRSPTEMSIDNDFDFDPSTERSHRSEEMGEDQENDSEIMRKTTVKTRYGRLSKRRHLDTEFSYNLALINTDSASSKPAKKKKIAVEKEQASISLNQSRSPSKSIRRPSRNSSSSVFSTESAENMEKQDVPRAEENPSDYNAPRIQELEDYDYNPREINLPESSSIDNFLGEPKPSAAKDHNPSIEARNIHNRSDAVASELHPEKESLSLQNETNSTSQTNGKEVISPEVPIKVENEEPTAIEDNPEDVKPVTAHNPKIKFFEAMQSLILFLDTPSLSKLQSKIHQRIRKIKGSKEVLQNNELIPAFELLVARMTNHSVIDISNNMETVSLIQFFSYLKASLLNSKMTGLEVLTNNISGLIEKIQNKRIPMKKVTNALRATLDIDDF